MEDELLGTTPDRDPFFIRKQKVIQIQKNCLKREFKKFKMTEKKH